ncbi:MAG: rod shape-determining protein RodA [Bacteroidales bacterium]|nr:rod shape-determining protein RodA [Bacteroidales bacterium]MBN2758107.1 rod shape-determining protein RodA [Bacteroidales bacterium]
MRRTSNVISNIDWTTVAIYFILVILGWGNIYAAVYNEDHGNIFDITQRYGKQLIWISISIVLIILIFIIDSKAYDFFAYPAYLFMLIILIAVLLFGTKVHGARSWFEIGSIRIQPAEFAKLTTALALARFMSAYNFKITRINDLIKATVIIFTPSALIILQNDTGSALVYFSFIIVLYRGGLWSWIIALFAILGVLFVSALMIDVYYLTIILPILSILIFYIFERNIKAALVGLLVLISVNLVFIVGNIYFFNLPKSYILFLGIISTIIVLIYPVYINKIKNFALIASILIGSLFFTFSVDYLFHKVLEKHQRTRINVLLGLESDPTGVEYNVNQSKIAIGSGGFSGKGFLQGTQTKFDFVPEQDTDFIFCTVGEEWGFIGTSVIILLFMFLLLRLINMAERQKSRLSQFYGYGVISILFFHIVINIGMTIGLVPVIGIPLPFFSYGGSSLWSFTILLFIFIRFDASRIEQL